MYKSSLKLLHIILYSSLIPLWIKSQPLIYEEFETVVNFEVKIKMIYYSDFAKIMFKNANGHLLVYHFYLSDFGQN